MQIAIVLFPDFTAKDVIGPYAASGAWIMVRFRGLSERVWTPSVV